VQGVAAEVEMLRGPVRMLAGSHMHVQVDNGRYGSLTGVCIQKEQQEVMGPLCKITIGACSRQLAWLWWQEELLEVQVMHLDGALVVGGAPGDCSALLAIHPSPELRGPQRSTEPFRSHKVECT
jgi:hypothetical protein